MNATRQAAIVVASLDREAADALLDRLPESQAAEIRYEIMQLSELTVPQREQAIGDYLGPAPDEPPAIGAGESTPHDSHADDNDLDEPELADAEVGETTQAGNEMNVAEDVVSDSPSNAANADSVDIQLTSNDCDTDCSPTSLAEAEACVFGNHDDPDQLASDSLQRLLTLSDNQIVAVVRHERAATVSALLVCLPGERAAAILQLLPAGIRADVVGCLSLSMPARPIVAAVIADVICEHFQQGSSVGTEHHQALRDIMHALPPEQRSEMLSELESENPALASRLRAG